MTANIWLWAGFNVFVLLMLALDLGVFHRKAHVVSFRESITWTVIWIVLAMVFNFGVWHHYLKIGLGLVLTFVGIKMLVMHTHYKIDTLVSLAVVLGILAASVIASLLRPRHPVTFDGPSGPETLSSPSDIPS